MLDDNAAVTYKRGSEIHPWMLDVFMALPNPKLSRSSPFILFYLDRAALCPWVGKASLWPPHQRARQAWAVKPERHTELR